MRTIERPCPDWPLQRLIGVLYKHVDDAEALEAMAGMQELAEEWRVIARRRGLAPHRRLDEPTPRAACPPLSSPIKPVKRLSALA
jgi:hypothetical protein